MKRSCIFVSFIAETVERVYIKFSIWRSTVKFVQLFSFSVVYIFFSL
jgi:hypothetical protein